MSFVDRFALPIPVIQASMAGISAPALAVAVSDAGGLGSIELGAVDAGAGRAMIGFLREKTDRPFAADLFAHRTPQADTTREAAWIERLAPNFATYGATPPAALRIVCKSTVDDPDMLGMVLDRPPDRQLPLRAVRPGHPVGTAGSGICLTATEPARGRQGGSPPPGSN